MHVYTPLPIRKPPTRAVFYFMDGVVPQIRDKHYVKRIQRIRLISLIRR